ncbi:MAG: EamA family transporter RarD [Burkholderiaceae bacterium]|nr:EamA family transporter RarD [Burkholderiaceae bacterium]
MNSTYSKGVLSAALAYICWGLFPLYFRQVAGVSSLEVVLHRTVWSMVFVLGVLAVMRRWAWLSTTLRSPKVLGTFVLSALLLSCNWLVYVWAVQNHHVMDASLGYFINPLVNVLLGYLVLHERPRPVQWMALSLAALGVLWLTWTAGHLPWIALALAGSFGLYGLLRKTATLGALEGLALETMVLAPVAALWLGWLSWQGQSSFGTASTSTMTWLVLAGPLTAIPLLLFATGARRIPLATLGVLQYLSPSLQFCLGLWVFHEPLQPSRLIGFVFIWAALLVYSAEGLWVSRRPALQAA